MVLGTRDRKAGDRTNSHRTERRKSRHGRKDDKLHSRNASSETWE